ncbi:MAG: DUF1499 domain-containing protein [Capsulimonadaceae bacterium]
MDNRTLRRVALAAGVAIGASATYIAWANRRLFLVNDVTTGESPAYPTLKSRVYYAPAVDVIAAAQHAIRTLPGWRVVHVDTDNDALEAEVEAIGGSLDDVSVTVQPLTLGQSRVTIRSRSRQGRGDLGSNACHIRSLQTAMDGRLTNGAAI